MSRKKKQHDSRKKMALAVGLILLLVCQQANAQSGDDTVATDLSAAIQAVQAATQAAEQATRQANEVQQALGELPGSATSGDIHAILNKLDAKTDDNGALRLSLSDQVLFGFDSANISKSGTTKLHDIARVIKNKAKGKIWIVGHTDALGTAAYNQDLSRKRAAAVADWLARFGGIPAEKMIVQGAGAEFPVAPNKMADGRDNPQGRAKNRRVEIHIATRPDLQLGVAYLAAKDPTLADGPGNCASLCRATSGRHDMNTIACVEAAFEEQGYDMDSASCNKLEEAMLLGIGNGSGQVCSRCIRENAVGNSQCAKVQATCFSK